MTATTVPWATAKPSFRPRHKAAPPAPLLPVPEPDRQALLSPLAYGQRGRVVGVVDEDQFPVVDLARQRRHHPGSQRPDVDAPLRVGTTTDRVRGGACNSSAFTSSLNMAELAPTSCTGILLPASCRVTGPVRPSAAPAPCRPPRNGPRPPARPHAGPARASIDAHEPERVRDRPAVNGIPPGLRSRPRF